MAPIEVRTQLALEGLKLMAEGAEYLHQQCIIVGDGQ